MGGCHPELVDMPECISIEEIQHASLQDVYLQQLKTFIIAGLPHTKDELHIKIRPYWLYRDKLVVIDGVILKGRHIIIPDSLKQQVLTQLHTNHMDIEKTKLLACESVFWHNINTNIEAYIKVFATGLEFQQTQPKEKIMHHNKPLRPWEVIGTDVFHFKNKHYLCVVDYNSKFPVIKRLEGLSADNLINMVKTIFAEYGIPCKLMSYVGTNFISGKFHQFSKLVNIEQVTLSAYHHQSNRQVEACIKFVKCTFKKCTDSGRHINIALLQICMTPLGHGLLSLAALMFIRPVHGIMPVIDCKPLVEDCDDDCHGKLIERQQKNNNDTAATFPCIPIGSAVAVQQEDSGPWTDGAVVGIGNHNHYNKSYTIQLTTNGRHITCNRHHNKPTAVIADTYIQYHSRKQQNTRTDPLAEILNNITKNPAAYVTRQTTNDSEQSNTKQKEEAKDNEHCSKEASNNTKQPCTQAVKDNRTIIKYGDTIRTR